MKQTKSNLVQTIKVSLKEKSHSIFIGEDLLSDPNIFLPVILAKQVLIISHSTIADLYLDRVLRACEGLSVKVILLPEGEVHKNTETLNLIYAQLVENNFHRNSTLIALGGGVIGDITGFAAATYQRGIHYLQAPTTLLAQTDAAIGGKTAINHPLGKNMIGAFHQPEAIIIDAQVLATLPVREYRAGLAEVIKYGLLDNAEFFAWLETNWQALLAREKEVLRYAITFSCQTKVKFVTEDVNEKNIRTLLNLGHTFAHAIESATAYEKWLHGEAVAVGLLMAAVLSEKLGFLDAREVERIRKLLENFGLPTTHDLDLSSQEFIHFMKRDKKNTSDVLRLILLKRIGQAFIYEEPCMAELSTVIAATSQ